MLRHRSVLVGEHDGEDAPRRLWVGRVRRAPAQEAVVVVNFPIELHGVDFEGAEVVLAVRVVCFGVVGELANC